MLRIAEIFESLQGEGRLTGARSVFIRVSGCNLRCVFCDTRYASWEPEGPQMSLDQILDEVAAYNSQHVVLTGGEPMLFPQVVPLCEALKSQQKHITIETAGTVFQPVVCDLMSISPKTSNSTPNSGEFPVWHQRHESRRDAPEVMDRLLQGYDYQIKFVVESERDLGEIASYLESYPRIQRDFVMLMPQATTPPQHQTLGPQVESWCERQGLTYCPRMHVEWFGGGRGV